MKSLDEIKLERLQAILTIMGGEDVEVDGDTISFDFKGDHICIMAEEGREGWGYFNVSIERIHDSGRSLF
jgi:hypothetical protein